MKIKSIITATLLTGILVMPMATQAETKTLLKCDIDYNGAINAVDASIILTEYAMTSVGNKPTFTRTEQILTDTNNDKKVDAIDASTVLGIYAQNSVSTKKPYPKTEVSFSVQVRAGNDLLDYVGFTTYEECKNYIKQDIKVRTPERITDVHYITEVYQVEYGDKIMGGAVPLDEEVYTLYPEGLGIK